MGFQLLVDSYAIYNSVKRFESRKDLTVGLGAGLNNSCCQNKIGLLIVFKEEISTKRSQFVASLILLFIFIINVIFYIALSMLLIIYQVFIL